MSALSISNHLIMRLLQRQNTKHVIAKQMRMSAPSLPSLPSGPSGSNVTSDTIEAVPKDVKIDIVSEDVKAFDATQTHTQVPAPMQAQVHPIWHRLRHGPCTMSA